MQAIPQHLEEYVTGVDEFAPSTLDSPARPSSSDNSDPPPPASDDARNVRDYRKCEVCAKKLCFNDCFPADITWAHNTAATPYCWRHYSQKLEKMEDLIDLDGYSQKKVKKRDTHGLLAR